MEHIREGNGGGFSWRHVWEQTGDVLLILDDGLKVVRANPSACDRFEMAENLLAGRFLPDLFPGAEFPPGILSGGVSDPETTARDVEIHLPGTGDLVRISLVILREEKGGCSGILCTVRDITPYKRVESYLRDQRDQLRRYLNVAGGIIVALDRQGRVTFINRGGCEILGYEEEDVIGTNWMDTFVPENARASVLEIFQNLVAGDADHGYFENPVLLRDGRQRWIRWYNTIFRDASGMVTGTLSSGEDVTVRRQAEDARKNSERKYRDLVENALVGIYQTTLEGELLYANEAAAEILEYSSPADLVGRSILMVYRNIRDREKIVEELRKTGRVGSREVEMVSGAGNVRTVLISATLEDNTIVGMIMDITPRKKAEETIRRLAFYDSVTGLPNRSLFSSHLERELARAQRTGRRIALMVMDLDRFKNINDTMGHVTGDQALRVAGERIQAMLRKSDMVARMGGDEFILLLSDFRRVEEVDGIARRILGEVGTPMRLYGREVLITVSIGISIYPDHGANSEMLIRNADSALYRVKETGRNGYRYYAGEKSFGVGSGV